MGMSGDSFERRFEIVAETRRRWSREEKLAIVKEACEPCANVSAVARQHGVKPSLLYRWKKQFGGGTAPALVAVKISEPAEEESSRPLATSRPTDCIVEVGLGNGRTIRVPVDIEGSALRRIVVALEG